METRVKSASGKTYIPVESVKLDGIARFYPHDKDETVIVRDRQTKEVTTKVQRATNLPYLLAFVYVNGKRYRLGANLYTA